MHTLSKSHTPSHTLYRIRTQSTYQRGRQQFLCRHRSLLHRLYVLHETVLRQFESERRALGKPHKPHIRACFRLSEDQEVAHAKRRRHLNEVPQLVFVGFLRSIRRLSMEDKIKGVKYSLDMMIEGELKEGCWTRRERTLLPNGLMKVRRDEHVNIL